MNVTRIARGFLGRLEAAREGSTQENDLLVQARRGNVDAVVDLLDGFDPQGGVLQPADVRTTSVKGNNVLHLAAKFGHLEVVTLMLPKMLNTCPELVYASNSKGFTPLTLAVVNGHERVAMYLLAMTTKLFVDRVLPGRKRTLLHEAARNGLATVVAKLLQLFPQLFTGAERDVWTQRTAIHEALLVGIEVVQDGELFPWNRHHGHYTTKPEKVEHAMAVLETLLAKAPHAPLDAKDFVGFTPLHIAAARGNLHAVTRLLAFGADVSIKDDQDRTAWRVALLRGHEACFQEIRRKWLQDVVSNAAPRPESSTSRATTGSTLSLHPQLEKDLVDACRRGEVAKMRFFVDECDVSVNAIEEVEHGFYPRSLLMIAVEHRQVQAVKFLLSREELDVKYTADGHSALTIAQRNIDN